MKKFMLMFALMVSAVLSANAQIATENSKLLDNTSVGVTVGASTPLDFNSVFALNPNVGVKLQKDFTPVVGLQIEGLAILNDNHFSKVKTTVKATNVGANGVVNLSNAIWGYKGTPRTLEISAVGGLGWLHTWTTSINNLTAKTGLDLALNLGSTKAHSIVVTPAIYWNLNKNGDIEFNKHGAQLAVNVTYVYHFKTSNGTHAFKTYDVGALNDEINRCRETNANLTNQLTNVTADNDALKRENSELKNKLIEALESKPTCVTNDVIVEFAQGSSVLTNEAKAKLSKIGKDVNVNVVGQASPEGSDKRNIFLSKERAAKVTEFLTTRDVKVNSSKGIGAPNSSSNRIVTVTVVD